MPTFQSNFSKLNQSYKFLNLLKMLENEVVEQLYAQNSCQQGSISDELE